MILSKHNTNNTLCRGIFSLIFFISCTLSTVPIYFDEWFLVFVSVWKIRRASRFSQQN